MLEFVAFFIELIELFFSFLFGLRILEFGSLGNVLVSFAVLGLFISFFILPFRIQRGSDGGGD